MHHGRGLWIIEALEQDLRIGASPAAAAMITTSAAVAIWPATAGSAVPVAALVSVAAFVLVAALVSVAGRRAVRRLRATKPIGIGRIRRVWGGLKERMHRAAKSMPAVRHTTDDVPGYGFKTPP